MNHGRFAMVFTLTTLMAVGAAAFDGQRRGFILGGGLGFGMTSFTQTIEGGGISITSDRENEGAFMTDFRIGWGANEQTEIYYASKVSWFGITNVNDDDVTIANGIGGIGFTHSLKYDVPTWFVTGGIGLATWSLPLEDNAPDAWNGFGLFAGMGYEFSKHYCFEFDLIYGNPGDSDGGVKVSSSALSLKASINALAY
jgi:hypothetical protein